MSKVLCLHGYTQTASIFKKRLGAFLKNLKKLDIEAVFIDAPHIPTDGEGRAWWNAQKNYVGLQESIELVKQAIDEHQPCCILGFSQGAAMASIMTSISKVNAVVLVGGFVPKDGSVSSFNGPQLHVMGITDELVTPQRSQELITKLSGLDVATTEIGYKEFGHVAILQHEGGHFVPGKSIYRKHMADWINEYK